MWKLYVGNLSSRIREMELANEFRVYGLVRRPCCAHRRTLHNQCASPFFLYNYRVPPLPLLLLLLIGLYVLWSHSSPTRSLVASISTYHFLSVDCLLCLYLTSGKHGWRVEMSQKSSGGMRRRSPSRDSRCQECSSHRHHTRDCQSRASRSSSRRSSCPHSRTLMSRDCSQRRLSRSRSPLHNDRCNESCSSPRNHEKSFPEKIECIRSPQNAQNGSPSAGSAQGHEDGPSRKSGSSKSPQNDLNSPQTDGCVLKLTSDCFGQHSPKEPEYSSSPRSGCSRSPDDAQKGFQRDGLLESSLD